MVKYLMASASLVLFLACSVFAQKNDPVLFTVDKTEVPVSEFTYIYSKTNQEKADFSEASLRDYLDLYVKFKLKVHKARDMRLDTIQATKSELDGYRRQLAASYLIDREVTDKLIRETYDRMTQDVDISHIFISCDKNAKAADTLKAYTRAMNIYQKLKAGANFEQMALDSSDDKTVKENRGNLGFVTAMLPDGYYNLEKAAYGGKAGALLMPLRTNSGYHIARVNAFRPARGEVEVAQILLRKSDNAERNTLIMRRADSLAVALQNGDKWDDACAKFSDDKMTAGKGGYIGFFGINRYQRAFEDAAFGLSKDGDISKPVETSIGYHIIKRISARPVGTFEQTRRALTERVKRDSRSESAKQSMIARIKREGSFQEFPEALNAWSARQVDSVFHTFKWKPDPAKPQTKLFAYGSTRSFTVADFEEFLTRSSRERMRGQGFPVSETIGKLYKQFVDESALSFEESQLDKKYPEFKSLMREYEEGMLLFDAMKQLVWDRANTDSTGLEQYFNENLKTKYKWDERARVSLYTVKSDDPKVIEKVRALAAKKPAADVLKKFNKKKENDVVAVMERLTEKGKNKDLGDLWKAGALTETKTDAGTKTATFSKIEAIEAPAPKALHEARGYAVADYQDYLEKRWVEELRQAYKVTINEAVLKSLIRK